MTSKIAITAKVLELQKAMFVPAQAAARMAGSLLSCAWCAPTAQSSSRGIP